MTQQELSSSTSILDDSAQNDKKDIADIYNNEWINPPDSNSVEISAEIVQKDKTEWEDSTKILRPIFGNEERFIQIGDQKNPLNKNWQTQQYTLTECFRKVTSDKYPTTLGVGIVTGNGYIAIDFDGYNATNLAKELAPFLLELETLSWTSGKEGRRQILCKIPDNYLEKFEGKTVAKIKETESITAINIKGDSWEQLELRHERMQSVLPPSYHPDTGKYKWLDTTHPVELTDKQCDRILSLFNETTTKTVTDKKGKTHKKDSINGRYTQLTDLEKKEAESDLIRLLKKLEYLDLVNNPPHYQSVLESYTVLSLALTGERNVILNKVGFDLGQLINEKGLDNKETYNKETHNKTPFNECQSQIRKIILYTCKAINYDDTKGINGTLISSWEDAKNKPRSDRPNNNEDDLKEKIEQYERAIKDTTIIDTLETGFDGILVYEDSFLDWYFYDDKVKHFDKKSEIRIKRIIRNRRIELSKSLCRNIGIPEDHPKVNHNPSSKNVAELYESLKMIFVGEIDNSLHGYLPLNNGMLHLETSELIPHNPYFKNTYCLPHDYDPNADCPEFLNWLTTQALNNPEDLIIIQAFFYATLTGMGVQKFLELIGRPRSGKGTLMRVLTTLMGAKNSANVELEYLEKERFILAKVIDKRLIAISETEPDNKRKITRFLALIGRDPQTIEEKNKPIADKDKTFQGLVLFASNYPIEGNDPAKALDTRRITVHMDNVLDNEDKREPLCEEIQGKMTGKFVKEMSGILNWALSIDYRKAKLILLNPESHVKNYKNQVLEDELGKTDLLPLFLENCCVIDPNGKVLASELFQEFTKFYQKETGQITYPFKTAQNLMARIRPLLQKYKVKYSNKPRDRKSIPYHGIRLKNYDEEKEIGLVTQAYTTPKKEDTPDTLN